MRKDVAVLMVLWVMCIPYATFICASATPNKLDTLKAFLRKKILYDEYVPIDSVICWSENILPVITRRHQPRHRPGTTNVRRSQRNGI